MLATSDENTPRIQIRHKFSGTFNSSVDIDIVHNFYKAWLHLLSYHVWSQSFNENKPIYLFTLTPGRSRIYLNKLFNLLFYLPGPRLYNWDEKFVRPQLSRSSLAAAQNKVDCLTWSFQHCGYARKHLQLKCLSIFASAVGCGLWAVGVSRISSSQINLLFPLTSDVGECRMYSYETFQQGKLKLHSWFFRKSQRSLFVTSSNKIFGYELFQTDRPVSKH